MLGAVAAGAFSDLAAAMPAMSSVKMTYQPDPGARALHAARFDAFLVLQATARDIRTATEAALAG